MVFDRTIVDNA